MPPRANPRAAEGTPRRGAMIRYGDTPHCRLQEELRGDRGPQRHRPHGERARAGLHHRPLRLRQEHAAALHQPAGGAERRQRAFRWAGGDVAGDRAQYAAPLDGHGVPVLQPLSAHDGARQRHAGVAQGAQEAARGGRRDRPPCAGRGRPRRQGRELPQRAVRRPAAARRHRPRPGTGPAHRAVRRADLGARSRARRLGAGRAARLEGARHDHAGGEPRAALCPRRRRPHRLHGPGPDRRGGPAVGRPRRAPRGPHPRLRRRAAA